MTRLIVKKITEAFLRRIQEAGWLVERVEQDHVVAKCPADGCALRARLRPEQPISRRSAIVHGSDDHFAVVNSYDDLRVALRRRREDLALSQYEVDELGGFTSAHIAKAEKDNPIRYMTLHNVIAWANTLGLELVLRPSPVPSIAMKQIVESQGRIPPRRSRFAMEKKRRGSRARVTR
jgi:hypothetical protein